MILNIKEAIEHFPVKGIRWGTAACGIKVPGKPDVALMSIENGSTCAAVFTQNKFCAAPVTVARQHLKRACPEALLINSGNANAGTGQQGMDDALLVCEKLAKLSGCEITQVLPFSTGVIGEPLPVDKILAKLPEALKSSSESAWDSAAYAIMTTDTRPKLRSKVVVFGDRKITLTGITKGAGMIRPNMATMLAFLATDAQVAENTLQAVLEDAVDESFNAITVDGDTSTNDACILIATGQSGVEIDQSHQEFYNQFKTAVNDLCRELAIDIVKDAEGATKLLKITVKSGKNKDECRAVADCIAHSPLVKTAFFASDPNWGRILAAIGRAPIHELDISKVNIFLDEVNIVENGSRVKSYSEELGQEVMNRSEIAIEVELNRGQAHKTIWTCDLSHEYVRINSEYRS